MSNLRGAPLFLRPSVVRGLVEASEIIRKGVIPVPIVPVKLVDRPRRSEDPRLAKANDDIADAPRKPRAKAKVSGRGAPPAASEPVPAQAAEPQPAPEDWPDAPLPEHADPDLDRTEPNDSENTSCSRPPVEESGLVGMAARGSVSQCQLAKPQVATCDEKHSPTPDSSMGNLARRKRDSLYYQDREQDARALEQPVDQKVDRLAVIRAAATRVSAKPQPAVPARPSLGVAQEGKPVPLPALPFVARRQRLDAAIAFLNRLGIMVAVVDREAAIRKYRVGGKPDPRFAEEVVEIAVVRGMELPA